MTLTLQEQETHLNMTADDRGTWHVYSDDPVMQRRLESIGAELVKAMPDGIGKQYTLRADQVLLRTGKRKMSDKQKVESANRLRALRTTLSGA